MIGPIRHKPDAVLLDWDDHLVDSTEYYRVCSEKAVDILVKDYGYPAPSKLYREKGKLTNSEYFKEQFGEEGAKKVIAIREEMLMDGDLPPPQLRPGAEELLTFLALNNIPYAIVSDTPQERLSNNVKRTLDQAGLPVPLHVGISDEHGVLRKPHESGIKRALKLLSEQTGTILSASPMVIMSGDRPDKDGMAARNAGINHAIIVHEKSGSVEGWQAYDDLHVFLKHITRTVGQELRTPRFVKRALYDGISRQETEIVCDDNHFIESPLKDALGEHSAYTPEEEALHNLRWIAKRAQNLDGTGHYTREEQMEAAYEVVDQLLTPAMLDELTSRTVEAVKARRAKGQQDEIVVHLPHRVVNPPKPIENMLSVAYNYELANRMNVIFAEKHPELNVRFDSTDRLLSGLSIEKSEQLEAAGDVEVIGLTGNDPKKTVQAGRSTGNLLERIAKQPIFDYSSFKLGDMVIITDDHVQGGGTFVTWYHALKERGVEPIAFTVLSTMPESRNMQPHPDIHQDMEKALTSALDSYCAAYPSADRACMEQKFHSTLDKTLQKVGISVGTLSNREALTLMAYLIDGTNDKQVAWFKEIAPKYGADLSIVERKDESLTAQASEPSVSPMQLMDRMEILIPKYTTRERA